MKHSKDIQISKTGIRFIVVGYAIVVLTLILLAASNYPVQWRAQVDAERMRNLEVYAQALKYYQNDHDAPLNVVPESMHIISNDSSCMHSCSTVGAVLPCFNLQESLVPGYLRELPQDPLYSSSDLSGYYIQQSKDGFILGACNAFFGEELVQKASF